MQLEDLKIGDLDRINTGLLNQLLFRAYTDYSTLFDRSFESLGKIDILNIALRLIDNSNKRIIAQAAIQPAQTYDLTIGPTSALIYPSSVQDTEKATVMQDFGVITSKILHRDRIFTSLADVRILKPGVTLAKSSHNYIFLSRPEAVFESDLTDVLLGEFPYLLRFVGADIQEAQVDIEAVLNGEINTFNTLEYSPFPAGGLMELQALTINDIAAANVDGDIQFIESNRFQRTFPSYIPFSPIRGNRLNLSIINQSRLESQNGATVGVDLVEAFSTTYASVSYFGYRFTLSSDQKLQTVALNGTWAQPTIRNVAVRIYDRLEEFNAVSDKYLINIDDIIKGTLNLEKNKDYYVLFIMKSDDNTPQTISSVGINFG